MLTVRVNNNHGICIELTGGLKTVSKGGSISSVCFVADYIGSKRFSDINSIIGAPVVYNHYSIDVFYAALDNICNGVGLIIGRHGCNSNGHMQSPTPLGIKVRSLLNKIIYYRRVSRSSKSVEYIFQSHRSITFKGFQGLLQLYLQIINRGIYSPLFNKKKERRYSVSESHHLI